MQHVPIFENVAVLVGYGSVQRPQSLCSTVVYSASCYLCPGNVNLITEESFISILVSEAQGDEVIRPSSVTELVFLKPADLTRKVSFSQWIYVSLGVPYGCLLPMFTVNTQWHGIREHTVAPPDWKEKPAASAKLQVRMADRKLRSTFIGGQEIGLAGGSQFDLWCP